MIDVGTGIGLFKANGCDQRASDIDMVYIHSYGLFAYKGDFRFLVESGLVK